MTAYYNEIDPYCCAWLSNLMDAGHITPGKIDDRSIEDICPDELAGYERVHMFAGVGVWDYALNQAGWKGSVWTGSCPCQPFSAAGAGAGFDDERHLWPHFHWLIEQCKPAVVLGEQVASKAAEPWLDLVQADLETLGYAFGSVAFPSAGVGAPHIRDRSYWVGHANGVRLEPAPIAGIHNAEHHAEPCGGVIGLADTASGRCKPRERYAGVCDQNDGPETAAEQLCAARSPDRNQQPGPVNGFWAAADWLLCRDGKWRPVEPIHVKMVDGATSGMGCLCSYSDSEKEKVNEVVQGMREIAGPKKIQQRGFGKSGNDEAAQILRPDMHGSWSNENEMSELESQPFKSKCSGEGRVPGVRRPSSETACSPCGSRSAEQCAIELDDFVPFLSPSITLAELDGRRADAKELHLLREKICEEGGLQYPSEQVASIWASLGEEAKDRVRMGFDATRWKIVVPFPLTSRVNEKSSADWHTPAGEEGFGHRAGRLKGYGNAINAEAATQFIAAYMEGVQ